MRAFRVGLVLGLVAAGVAGWYLAVPYGAGNSGGQPIYVEIAPGTGTAGIAAALERGGVIRSRYAFEAWRVWKGVAGRAGTLKAGEYRFDHAANVAEVYDRLRRGDVFTITVAVPEGYNVFDVADAVQKAGLGTREAFLAAAMTHVELVRRWSPHAQSVEGFLFPDTYKFGRHATPVQMIATMVARFTVEATRLGLNGTDAGRVVTMASLVEKEVHVDAERPVVAGVFENRLAAGMPLQTDPAVIYASLLRGTWTGVIHQSELHSDSAYNTYAHAGLPPGPICNPGMAALKAALHPAQTEFLYFVANADGTTKFAASLAEHTANVTAYRAGK